MMNNEKNKKLKQDLLKYLFDNDYTQPHSVIDFFKQSGVDIAEAGDVIRDLKNHVPPLIIVSGTIFHTSTDNIKITLENAYETAMITDAGKDYYIKYYLKDNLNSTITETQAFSLQKIKTQSKNKNFSHRQIAIAYCVLNIVITSENAKEILQKYSQTRSTAKLLQKRINKASELTKISENKTTDTKYLQDLKEAKRLISGIKNKKANTDIDRIITAFQTAYDNHY